MSKAQELVSQMTIEEKVCLLSGNGFWWTKSIDRLNLPEIMMSDGPHGLRKQEKKVGNETVDESKIAVCYPTASLSACSFDRDILFLEGASIGEEAVGEKVSIVLGPGVNIKRNPLCGRNFEYFSEDPYLAGEMGAYWVKGVRSKGVFCSLKHFCSNNQERYRMIGDMQIDERTLREIYLTAFERVVKEDPGTVMCCYNSVNGTFGSENKHTLTEILRDEWGFKGITMTDWGAINDRVLALQNGMDLEMPSSFGERDVYIKKAVERGALEESVVDRAAIRMVELILEAIGNIKEKKADLEKCHQNAIKIAENSMVLLKNDNVLPIEKEEKVLVVGQFAKNHRFQGSGSSMINPYKVENLMYSLYSSGYFPQYAQGYDLNKIEVDENLEKEAIELAKEVEKVIIMCGLTNLAESEGYDRENMKMPQSHLSLIDKICEVNNNVIVCLVGGSPVEMDFADKVKGIVNVYLSGEGGGKALANILTGEVNPSGRLAESIAYRLEDHPSTKNFPGKNTVTEYREGLFVGYRFFDSANVDVRYPFGYGLSYTSFEYSNISYNDNQVTITVKNVGDRKGADVIQVYVGKENSEIIRVKKELKGFVKVELAPQEEKTVTIPINDRSFSYFNVDTNKFEIEGGEYTIYVAKNVRDVIEEIKVTKEGSGKVPTQDREKLNKYFNPNKLYDVNRQEFEELLGRKIVERSVKPYTLASTMEEIRDSFFGNIFYKISMKIALEGRISDNDAVIKMLESGAKEASIKSIPAMTGGTFNIRQCEGIVDLANGKFFKGVAKLAFGKREKM